MGDSRCERLCDKLTASEIFTIGEGMSELPEITEESAAPLPGVAARRAAATRARILDAAEYLFGHGSPDTVSLRDISARAQVALGLVHHHFHSKEALIEYVVARRAQDLCVLRQQRLTALEMQGPPGLDAIIDAFFGPLFEKLSTADEGWRAYVMLLSQIGFTDRWTELRPRYFDPTLGVFLAALAQALPQATPEQLRYGFNFALMCMINVITQPGNLEGSVHGDQPIPGIATVYPLLLKFACAGLRGVVS